MAPGVEALPPIMLMASSAAARFCSKAICPPAARHHPPGPRPRDAVPRSLDTRRPRAGERQPRSAGAVTQRGWCAGRSGLAAPPASRLPLPAPSSLTQLPKTRASVGGAERAKQGARGGNLEDAAREAEDEGGEEARVARDQGPCAPVHRVLLLCFARTSCSGANTRPHSCRRRHRAAQAHAS